MSRTRVVIAVVVLVLVAGGCGARVTDEQRAAATQGNNPGGPAAGGETGTAAVEGVGAASEPENVGGEGDPGGSAAPGATAAAPGPVGPAGAAGARTGGGGAAGARTGGGGATDIGVTDTQIVLGNVATLSGPVPGLFQGAVIGTQAVVAYQNSVGGLFGRKFKLDVRDDQFDTGQNRAQTIDLLGKVFAFVGSFSLFEGAASAEIGRSGIPDVSYTLAAPRKDLANNFSPASKGSIGAATTPFEYWNTKFPQAVKSVGSIFTEVESAKINHVEHKAAAESVGWKFTYERAISPTETDFTADVVRMRQSGVKMVWLIGVDAKTLARLAKAMEQQGFKPEAFISNGTGYDPNLVALAGSAVEGMFNAQPYSMFLGEDKLPEVALFNTWVQKVKPGYKPDLFAVYSWAAGRLFFQGLEAAGPTATRADLVRELQKINDFSSNDLVSPAGPGTSKRPPACYNFMQIKDGKYVKIHPAPPDVYSCQGKFVKR